jgi:hypothetical protein
VDQEIGSDVEYCRATRVRLRVADGLVTHRLLRPGSQVCARDVPTHDAAHDVRRQRRAVELGRHIYRSDKYSFEVMVVER